MGAEDALAPGRAERRQRGLRSVLRDSASARAWDFVSVAAYMHPFDPVQATSEPRIADALQERPSALDLRLRLRDAALGDVGDDEALPDGELQS